MRLTFDDPALITLREASQLIPGAPSVSTLWRWTVQGQKGVFLAHIRIGGVIYTSRDALQTFFEEVTAKAAQRPVPSKQLGYLTLVDQTLIRQGYQF